MDTIPLYNQEHRRAIRMNWNRPVQISKPASMEGLAVNVSATGLLVNTLDDPSLIVGDPVAVIIPHATREDQTTVNGKIVRRQRYQDQLQIAIDFE